MLKSNSHFLKHPLLQYAVSEPIRIKVDKLNEQDQSAADLYASQSYAFTDPAFRSQGHRDEAPCKVVIDHG